MQKINSTEFISTLKRVAAIGAIGPSALRNQGIPGFIGSVREFLGVLDLELFITHGEESFQQCLNQQTERLLDILPVENRPWGTARKGLNLFLRDVLYNRYLCDYYGFQVLEPWLEIPLDSAVAQGLKKESLKGSLPIWPGLKHLTKEQSDIYQKFAKSLADQAGVARVHLDIFLWLENR